jgi:glycosyltransferase involved in cell wall biosynthesis
MIPSPDLVESHLLRGYDWERLRFSLTPHLGRELRKVCAEVRPEVLHDHGLWLHMNHVAAATAKRLGLKRVVSPRGMLEDWALSYRTFKKRLAWYVYQWNDLRSASAFCATSRLEADNIRALGFEQPIAMIPNGIDLRAPKVAPSDTARQRTILFMSRLHPKKGILDLVAAWSKVVRPRWRLIIAGPDENRYRAVVEAAVARERLSDSVSIAGPIADGERDSVLSKADVFVLPSYSENFGMVVGEALAAGLPVITTTATPWQVLQSAECGWWISPGAESMQAALEAAMTLPDDVRMAMGQRGRALIEAQFSWRAAAEKHVQLYRWLTGQAAAPECLLQ